jgi:hypothetical protein
MGRLASIPTGAISSCHHFASSCFGSNFPSSWTMKKSILLRPLHIPRQGIWVDMTTNFSLFLRDQGKRWPIIVWRPAVRCLKWDICDPHAHSPAWGGPVRTSRVLRSSLYPLYATIIYLHRSEMPGRICLPGEVVAPRKRRTGPPLTIYSIPVVERLFL